MKAIISYRKIMCIINKNVFKDTNLNSSPLTGYFIQCCLEVRTVYNFPC